MKVKDLFTLHQGNGFELMHLDTDKADINFVSRTARNNGVVAQVDRIEGIEPFPAGFITVALGGSVLSTFVQLKPFYTSFHMMVLEPVNAMTNHEKLYYCMCINANAYRYGYGRQANKTLKDIELPDDIPQWIYDTKINPITTAKATGQTPQIEIKKWGEYIIGDLFSHFENCKCSIARDLLDGDDCFYIGAKKNDNGVMRRVAYDKELITKGNCIVFICDGQGSVGYTNYMNNDFIGSSTLTVGYSKHLNKYVGMFLVTVLDLERPKYSFGRKYRTKFADISIKLPMSKNGSPDFTYMENYIRTLPYSDRI